MSKPNIPVTNWLARLAMLQHAHFPADSSGSKETQPVEPQVQMSHYCSKEAEALPSGPAWMRHLSLPQIVLLDGLQLRCQITERDPKQQGTNKVI